MSMKVIEINDSNIKVGDESGILCQSPGFALVTEDTLEIGEFAENHSRMQPTNSFNKYWHELNLEPISHSRKLRHHADLAYAQLVHLTGMADISQEVILSVPSNFSQEQLGILLGLARQTAFSPVGIVNTALVDSISALRKSQVLHADLQLHQVVLTLLIREENVLKVEKVVQVPGVGKQNFMNLMMQVATDLFIGQCRFNPQHDANSEQDLYNLLRAWLSNQGEEETVQLELKNNNSVHLAKLTRAHLLEVLGKYYKEINKQINTIGADFEGKLLLTENISGLPGFIDSISKAHDRVVLRGDQGIQACLEHRSLIASNKDEITLISKFKTSDLGLKNLPKKTEGLQTEEATHALFANEAIEIRRLDIKNVLEGPDINRSSRTLNFIVEDLPEDVGIIDKTDKGIYFHSKTNSAILNGRTIIKGKHLLRLGDHIKFPKSVDEIRLIKVRDGEK